MDPNERWDNVNVLTNSDGDLEIKNSTLDESEKFDIKSYIPKRSREKYLKPIYIISSVTVLVFLIIIVLILCLMKSNTDDSNKSSNLLPQGLIVYNNKSFWAYNPNNKVLNFLFKLDKPVNSFDVFSRKMIILNEMDISKVIFSSNKNFNLTFENVNTIFKEIKLKPQSVAVDFVTGNIYIIDELSKLLIVVDSQAKNYNILLSNLIRPREIVLDSSQGLMFICQAYDSILRGNMNDGTWLTEIVQDSMTSSITLDRKTKRIYWVQDTIIIMSSNYDGNDRKIILTEFVTVASLAILNDQFFWLWPNHGRVNATIWSCRLKNDTCEDHVMHKLDAFHTAEHIKASIDQDENIPNLCEVNNGGCQHLCLTAADGDRSCICKLGWQLNPDKRTCRLVTDFIIYLMDNLIKGRILHNTNHTKTTLSDAFWPKTYNVDSVKIKGVIDFEYDSNKDIFYYSDDTNIYQMKLKSQDNDEKILLQNEAFYTIEDLAYDWITGNMYYSLRSKSSSRRHYLMMFNVYKGSEYKKIIANFMYDNVFGLQACPYALAIYPTKGWLFFTAGENSQRSIQRITMNGTKLSQIYRIPFVHEHRFITIDYDKDKLYWIFNTDTSLTKIKYADFNGDNEKTVIIDSMIMARTISVYRQWLYLSNDTNIFRVHKETGKGLVKILPGPEDSKIGGARLITSEQTFKIGDDNPCAIDNGGCERFCFAMPKKTCDT